MRSPYGHPQAFSTTNGVKVQIGSPDNIEVDLYQDSNRSLAAGGSTTVDSVVATEGMLVLCPAQTTTTQDGLYYVDAVSGATCTLVRVPGFAAGDSINPGTVFRVRSGTVYAGRKLTVQGTAPLVLGTDALTVEMEPDASALVSTAGGALVGLADAGGFFTTDNVEAALQQLGALGLIGGITKLQLVTGTFVSGLCTVTVGANQAVTAATRAFPIMQAVVTGSTNVGMLTHMFANNVVGGNGVGQVLFRVLGNDGATDVDAAGAFAAILVN
jgi:hypothetical protein